MMIHAKEILETKNGVTRASPTHLAIASAPRMMASSVIVLRCAESPAGNTIG